MLTVSRLVSSLTKTPLFVYQTDQVFDVTQRLQQKAQQAHRARRQLWLRMVRQKRIHTALLTEASQLRRELRLHRLAAS